MKNAFLSLAKYQNSGGEDPNVVRANIEKLKSVFGNNLDEYFESSHLLANIRNNSHEEIFSLKTILKMSENDESYQMFIPLGLLIFSGRYSCDYLIVDIENGKAYEIDISGARCILNWNPGDPIPSKESVLSIAENTWPSINHYFDERIKIMGYE